LMLASKELLRQRQHHSQGIAITARKLADFLQTVENDEVLLTQRLRDQEMEATRSGITALAAESPPDEIGAENLSPEVTDYNDTEIYGEF